MLGSSQDDGSNKHNNKNNNNNKNNKNNNNNKNHKNSNNNDNNTSSWMTSVCVPASSSSSSQKGSPAIWDCPAQQIENGILETANLTNDVVLLCAPQFVPSSLAERIQCSRIGFRLLLSLSDDEVSGEANAAPGARKDDITRPSESSDSHLGASQSKDEGQTSQDKLLALPPATSSSSSNSTSTIAPSTTPSAEAADAESISLTKEDSVTQKQEEEKKQADELAEQPRRSDLLQSQTWTVSGRLLQQSPLPKEAKQGASAPLRVLAHHSRTSSSQHGGALSGRGWAGLDGPSRELAWSGYCVPGAGTLGAVSELSSVLVAEGVVMTPGHTGFTSLQANNFTKALSMLAIVLSACVLAPWMAYHTARRRSRRGISFQAPVE
ncbi:unnamed protein product [Polarella glacialis]|uniref:Uncharacterized protein n=1 Tax=Polarella glacialis TaxID=89957 RepID=A0A813J1N5_POLGL|nr:unnamed protein product [Polarella glacialis]